MARVLVTGAAGQVGSRLVRQLLARDHEVRGLILPDDPARSRLDGLEIEVVAGDLMDPETAEKAVAGVDAVVHTANLVGPLPGMSESQFFDNNVRTTFHMARAAARVADRLQRFVHISSSAVYPNDSQQLRPCYSPIDEAHPLRPRGVYALSKLIGEHILSATSRETGLPVAFIRPSGIVSGTAVLGRWTVGFVSKMLRVGQATPEGELYMADGTELWHALDAAAESDRQPCAITDTQGRPWMYRLADARDVAHACVCALESPAAVGEAFNAAAPEPIYYTEAAEALSEAIGMPVVKWQVPVRWVFDLSITKARSLIGYKPRWGIRQMIADAIAVQRGESDGMSWD
ncbi:MAG: NAD(P)-dependent oxidoreductase [Anaerolineae bacterium]|nr:NAD(P)-dependent oxidoreductase [Anaerolineae bacterium]